MSNSLYNIFIFKIKIENHGEKTLCNRDLEIVKVICVKTDSLDNIICT